MSNIRLSFFVLITAFLTAFSARAVVQPVGIRPGVNVPYTRLYNHRGPIMAEPNVYLIWYGDWNRTNGTDNAEGQQIVRDFLHALGGSPYFAINTTYSTTNTAITGNLTFAGETSDAYSRGKILTASTLLAVVTNSFVSNSLPMDTNGIYFVLASSDVYHTSGLCTRFCGLHKNAIIQGADIRYAFAGNTARCPTKCSVQYKFSPNNNPGVDGMVSIVAHELSEVVTDPDDNAWYDLHGYENADRCSWTYGHHQYKLPNGSWANMGWDFLDSNGAVLYHRDYLIQRNLLRFVVRPGLEVGYCATSYDPVTHAIQQ